MTKVEALLVALSSALTDLAVLVFLVAAVAA